MYYLGTGVTEQYHFDDSGLVYLKVDDLGGETWYGYDRLVWVENERSEGYAFVHDLFGRETLRTMLGGVDCAMQYDGVGRPSRQSITRSGRPVQAYDEHGTPVWQADYDIYGNLLNLKGDSQFVPFRQLGQYEDEETELYYNRFRYYDPNTGGYIGIFSKYLTNCLSV